MFSFASSSSRGVADKERHASPVFQLEMNLQTVRRTTVNYLEEVDQFECIACNSLQCRCSELHAMHSASSYSSDLTISYTSSVPRTESEYEVVCVPPPAHTLPWPRWVARPHPPPTARAGSPDLLTWVRSTKLRGRCQVLENEIRFAIDESVNMSPHTDWPPLPTSIWYWSESDADPRSR
ncbi:hypothetical protein ACJJTC_015447 [Scirpophaga incertulas]